MSFCSLPCLLVKSKANNQMDERRWIVRQWPQTRLVSPQNTMLKKTRQLQNFPCSKQSFVDSRSRIRPPQTSIREGLSNLIWSLLPSYLELKQKDDIWYFDRRKHREVICLKRIRKSGLVSKNIPEQVTPWLSKSVKNISTPLKRRYDVEPAVKILTNSSDQFQRASVEARFDISFKK